MAALIRTPFRPAEYVYLRDQAVGALRRALDAIDADLIDSEVIAVIEAARPVADRLRDIDNAVGAVQGESCAA